MKPEVSTPQDSNQPITEQVKSEPEAEQPIRDENVPAQSNEELPECDMTGKYTKLDF